MDYTITIIGAGVVGLAIAAELSDKFKPLAVVERHDKFGQDTSSRNSEVLHSGIYYPHNSLKARLCVNGQRMIYKFCQKYDIPHRCCGKFIVATTDDEVSKLNDIIENAIVNGVQNAKIIDQHQLHIFEPNVKALAAIHFPDIGIVDSFGLMKTYEALAINNNVDIAYNNEVVAIDKIAGGYSLTVFDGKEQFNFTSNIVINSSGLNADKVSEMVGLVEPEYKLHFWKGEYFAVGNGKNKLVNSLIYPVPNNKAGLGIHTTIDLGGGLKLGPNSFLVTNDEVNYKVDNSQQQYFYEAAKRYLPFLEYDDLMPHQAGLRPKLTNNANEFKDFIFKNELDAGFPNFINLLGIESPGLTASLAIAKEVERIIE